MLKETSIPLADIILNLASGPPAGTSLLFLHGVTRGWQDMLPLLPALHLHWQVHALDFRGHGLSGRAQSYLVVDHVGDVLQLVKTFAGNVVLYGHSLGALVALGVAAQLPGKVGGVILEDPPAAAFVRDVSRSSYFTLFTAMKELAGSTQSVTDIARRLADVRLPGPTTDKPLRLGDFRDMTSLRFSARCLQSLDPEVLTPLLEGRWLDGADLDAWARAVRCPALLLRGNETLGGMLPRAAAERLAGAMPDCILLDLPQVGHLIHQMETTVTVRLVSGFLESLR